MQSALLTEGPPRLWAVVFDAGEEALSGVTSWARDSGVEAASFTAIGALREAHLGWYDLERQQYADIPVREQVEVLTLAGDISHEPNGETFVHAHVVCGRRDGSTVGGHVREAIVRPTLEVMVTEAPAYLRRRHDKSTGLALIDLAASSVATTP